MDKASKRKSLHELTERELQTKLLLPLLGRMGYRGASIYHGPRERGKDLICFDLDRLRNREYLAIVAKAVDLNGSVSSSDGLREVVYQVEQCFNVPYEDLFGMRQITMDRVWVVTTGGIVPGASDSVFEYLRKQNLSKLVRFIPGAELVELVDQWFPDYWAGGATSIEQVRERASRYEAFGRSLLTALGGKPDEIEETLQAVAESTDPPRVRVGEWSLSRLSSYGVNLEPITGALPACYVTSAVGLLGKAFADTKRLVYYAMFDVDETMERYEKMMALSDPRAFVEAFDRDLEQAHPFWQSHGGAAGKAVRQIEYLRDAIQEVSEMLANLDKLGKRAWAVSLFESVAELEGEVESYLRGVEQDPLRIYWQVESYEGVGRLRLLYSAPAAPHRDVLETSHSAARGNRTTVEVLQWAGVAVRHYLEALVATT
jgi:hypothetical protein